MGRIAPESPKLFFASSAGPSRLRRSKLSIGPNGWAKVKGVHTTPAGQIAAWTASVAVLRIFLGLGKGSASPSTSRLLAVAEGLVVGGAIGFGFGIAFARPRNGRERWLRAAYAALPLAVIGTLLGVDRGIKPTILGGLSGIVVGAIVGFLVCLSSRVAPDQS